MIDVTKLYDEKERSLGSIWKRRPFISLDRSALKKIYQALNVRALMLTVTVPLRLVKGNAGSGHGNDIGSQSLNPN